MRCIGAGVLRSGGSAAMASPFCRRRPACTPHPRPVIVDVIRSCYRHLYRLAEAISRFSLHRCCPLPKFRDTNSTDDKPPKERHRMPTDSVTAVRHRNQEHVCDAGNTGRRPIWIRGQPNGWCVLTIYFTSSARHLVIPKAEDRMIASRMPRDAGRITMRSTERVCSAPSIAPRLASPLYRYAIDSAPHARPVNAGVIPLGCSVVAMPIAGPRSCSPCGCVIEEQA